MADFTHGDARADATTGANSNCHTLPHEENDVRFSSSLFFKTTATICLSDFLPTHQLTKNTTQARFHAIPGMHSRACNKSTAPRTHTLIQTPAPVCFSFSQLLATKSCCGLPNTQLFSQLL
jgi:hypothetical protein